MRYLLLTLLFVSTSLSGMIRTIDSFDELEGTLQELDDQALVLFDIDGVLLFGKDRITLPCNKFLYEKLWDEQFGELSRDEMFHFLSIFLYDREARTVETNAADFVRGLQARGAKTAALSAWWTGTMGSVASMSEQRHQELATHGFDFSRSLPTNAPVQFDEFERGLPEYMDGVILTDGVNKGRVLDAVLDHLSWQPSRVIYIDDHRGNLLDVKHVLHERGIPCELFHYLGSLRVEEEADETTAREQMHRLKEEQRWYSDGELSVE